MLGTGQRKHPHRTRYVLQRGLPLVVECCINTVADLPVGIIRHTHPAGLGDDFKTRSDIYVVAEDIVVIDDYIADMDADAKLDHLILLYCGILLSRAALNFHCTACRINGAGELDQHAITGRLDDAPAMGGNCRIDKGLSGCL